MASPREERLNQEWEELLEELKVMLPGAEVLFAFLLAIPFTERFQDLAQSSRHVYLTAFLAAAVATLLMIAPGAQHRVLWRQRAKDQQLRVATWLALAAMVFSAIAISSTVYLITNVVYENRLPAIATGVVAALMLWLWFAQPLIMRLRNAHEPEPAPEQLSPNGKDVRETPTSAVGRNLG